MIRVTSETSGATASFLVDVDDLPSPSALIFQILDYTAGNDLSIRVLAGLVGQDGALTAKLLRLANSAIYSFPSEVTSIDRAIMVLGVKAVRLLTLSLSLSALFPVVGEYPELLLDVRRRSVVNALANRGFLGEIDPNLRDEGFLVGLLNSLGALVVAQTAPHAFGRLFADGPPSPDQQRAELGFSLDDLTVALFDMWGMPGFLAEVIALRSHGFGSATDIDPSIEKLDLALQLASLAERVLCEPPGGQAFNDLAALALESLELGPDRVESILIELGPHVRDTAALLSLELPEDLDHEQLVRSAASAMQRLSLEALSLMSEQTDHLADLAAHNSSLVRDSLIDPLTGMGNHRAFHEHVESCVAMRRRRSFSDWLGLILISLDAPWPEEEGLLDRAVANVGAQLKRHCRAGEDFYRVGDATYALVMPHALGHDLPGAAQRFRVLVSSSPAVVGTDGRERALSACVAGALVRDVDAADAGAALRREVADRLVSAQRHGRNGVCVDPR